MAVYVVNDIKMWKSRLKKDAAGGVWEERRVLALLSYCSVPKTICQNLAGGSSASAPRKRRRGVSA